jgi:hypothetical protein
MNSSANERSPVNSVGGLLPSFPPGAPGGAAGGRPPPPPPPPPPGGTAGGAPPEGPPPPPPNGGGALHEKKFCANLDGAPVLASVSAAAAVMTVLVIAELCILLVLK